MGKPYSDLEKQALAIIRGKGDPATSSDKGLANYWKWRMDPSDTSHNLPSVSTRTTGRKLDFVSILPFAVLPVPTQRGMVTISQRSLAAAAAGLRAAAGLKLLSEEPTSIELGRFRPAKVYYRTGAGTTPSSRVSRITERAYKSAYAPGDEGYSIPFGRTNATDNLASTQADIAAFLKSGSNPINLITFSPEKYRRPA